MRMRKSLEELGGISLIHPFYNDEERLKLQFAEWKKWSKRVCENIDITLIDDHSDIPLKLGPKRTEVLKEKGITLSVYRIIDDLKWNTPGALNLGFVVAPKTWCLTMDSDCFFNCENWEKILDYVPRDDRLHKFNRKRFGLTESKNWLENTRYLPCTMLMHKRVFHGLNGFDEDFTGARTGGYGFFDNDFDFRAKRKGWKMEIVPDVIAGEWLPSISGPPVFPGITHGKTDHQKYHNINRELYNRKIEKIVPHNKEILRFKWERLYESTR